MTAAGLLLIGGVAGVAGLASRSDDEPAVQATPGPEPTGVYDVEPEPVATSIPATPSATPTPSLSTVSTTPPAVRRPPPPAASTPTTTRPPAPTPENKPSEVHYANCAEVKRAGAAPLYRGEPGYRRGLDPDNDGVACES